MPLNYSKIRQRPLPAWYYFYFVEFNDYENDLIYSKVLNFSFEKLISIHEEVKNDPYFKKDFYSERNMFTMSANFFHYFIRSMSCISNNDLLLEHIHFLEYLLNDSDIHCDLDLKEYSGRIPFECYSNDTYIEHVTFLTDFNPGFINKLQIRYRRNIHKKKLQRSLDIILHSPPKQVEFSEIDSFHGGIMYLESLNDYSIQLQS